MRMSRLSGIEGGLMVVGSTWQTTAKTSWTLFLVALRPVREARVRMFRGRVIGRKGLGGLREEGGFRGWNEEVVFDFVS